MADDRTVQRVPAGLLNVIGAQGARAVDAFDGSAKGVLELLQMFGLQQRTVLFTNNAAAAEGATVDVQLPASWCVLFGFAVTVQKTATMTALRAAAGLIRFNTPMQIMVSEELGPFGATETGPATAAFWAPYPMLCPPSSIVRGLAQIIGTDATANVTVQAELGVLG